MQPFFTETQLNNWAEYEAIRQSGEFNMFDPRALNRCGMTQDEWVFCMEYYDALEKAYLQNQKATNV